MMWLGEQVTERGIGNGISILIFAGIVSGFPSAIGQSFEQARQGEISIIATTGDSNAGSHYCGRCCFC